MVLCTDCVGMLDAGFPIEQVELSHFSKCESNLFITSTPSQTDLVLLVDVDIEGGLFLGLSGRHPWHQLGAAQLRFVLPGFRFVVRNIHLHVSGSGVGS